MKQIPALKKHVDMLLRIIEENPYQPSPTYERLCDSCHADASRMVTCRGKEGINSRNAEQTINKEL